MKKIIALLENLAASKYKWLLIFVLALVTRAIGAYIGGEGGRRGDDDLMHMKLAMSWLNGEGFKMYWQNQGPLYCFQPPGLGVFHILFVSVFKNFWLAERIFFVIMSSITAIFFDLLAQKFFKPSVAILATFVFVLYPPQWFWSTRINSHAYCTNMLVICLLLLYTAWQKRKLWIGLVTGILWGTMSLMRPEYMLGIFIFGFASFLYYKGEKFYRLAFPVILVVGWAAMMSPWVIRNYLKVHRLVLSSTHYSYNFWMVYNDEYTYGGNNFYPPAELDDRLKATDEMGKVDIWMAEGMKYIKADPMRAVKRSTLNFLNYWRPWLSFSSVPPFENLLYLFSWAPIFILFLIGLFKMKYSDPQWLAIWMFSLYKMMAQVPFYMIVRFREATFPLFLLMATIPIAEFFKKYSNQTEKSS